MARRERVRFLCPLNIPHTRPPPPRPSRNARRHRRGHGVRAFPYASVRICDYEASRYRDGLFDIFSTTESQANPNGTFHYVKIINGHRSTGLFCLRTLYTFVRKKTQK